MKRWARAVFAAGDELFENAREGVGGLARDLHAVVAEDRVGRLGQEESEGIDRLAEIAQKDALDRIEELLVEIIDPELVKVAEDHVARAIGDDELPVFERLVVVLLQLCAARFHLDERALGPEQIGEFLAAARPRGFSLEEFEVCGARFFRDAKLESGASLYGIFVAEGAKKLVEEGLPFAFLVALQPAGKGRKLIEGGSQFSRGHAVEHAGRKGAGQERNAHGRAILDQAHARSVSLSSFPNPARV
jgi:hypothetical protein